jgi:hypothetical protein
METTCSSETSAFTSKLYGVITQHATDLTTVATKAQEALTNVKTDTNVSEERFGGTFSLHLQDRKVRVSETIAHIYQLRGVTTKGISYRHENLKSYKFLV